MEGALERLQKKESFCGGFALQEIDSGDNFLISYLREPDEALLRDHAGSFQGEMSIKKQF